MMDVERHCQQVDGLLPWYVNRSLDNRDAEIVQAHLDDCERCRGEAEWLAKVGAHLRDTRMKYATPISSNVTIDAATDAEVRNDAEAPVSGLRERIAADRQERRRTYQALAAGLLLALATTIGVVMTWQPLAPRYHTVTDTVPLATNTVMLELELEPGAPLASLYGILDQYDAVIVAGPDPDGRVALEFRLDSGETAGSLMNALENDARVIRTARISTPEHIE